MSDPLATYSFLSWTRQGLANALTAPAAGALRPSLSVALKVTPDSGASQTIAQAVNLVGPGDVIGVSAKAIVRQDPANGVSDFLPNYFPFIEFYDEDFPWRHTPEPPDLTKDQLRPWIALVVLAVGEFDELAPAGPLGAIRTRDAQGNPALGASLFPPSGQLWAWAHVQVNADIRGDAASAAAKLATLVAANSDIAVSRLMCPRKLKPKTAYHAFLIPSYESGRCAGLGETPAATVLATDSAWGGNQTDFPYYYRWQFGTAERGDFEYLVGLLKPRIVDRRVGTRDMYVGDPGGVADAPNLAVLALEGALHSAQTMATPWPHLYPDAFQGDLAAFLNAADGTQPATDGNHDPIITPPLYGRWHALQPKLSLAPGDPYDPNARWITELNLDPRHRAAAGMGTAVIQDEQEDLMNQAWAQVGDVLEANRKIRNAQIAMAASTTIYNNTIAAVSADTAMALSGPLHAQVMGSEETIRYKVRNSPVPVALLSPTFRRALRPRGKLARATFPGTAPQPQAALLSRVNSGAISHAPPRSTPARALTLASVAKGMNVATVPTVLASWPAQALLSGLIRVLSAVQSGLQFVANAAPLMMPVLKPAITIVSGWVTALRAQRARPLLRQALSPFGFTPAAVAALPGSANFRLMVPGETVSFALGGTDNAVATRFKSALNGIDEQFALTAPLPKARVPLDLPHLHDAVMQAVEPWNTIPRRTASTLYWGTEWTAQLVETFVPVGAYPKFRRPMYEALRDLSVDNLIPNMNLVPNNSLSLLVENRRFIEAYMVGLNHEMAREFTWRGFPLLDQRGSYFRQFWDVRDALVPANLTAQAWADQMQDIQEIHLWSRYAKLGEHPNRPTVPGRETVVLLVRGNVLNRFPNAVIYAHRAQWRTNTSGAPIKSPPRDLAATTTAADLAANTRYPLYSATAAPDVTFIGFDLTVAEAKGTADDPGWFFVLKERPGETRFGLDVETSASSSTLAQWDDLSWEKIAAQGMSNGHAFLPSDPALIKPADPHIQGQLLTWSDQSNAAAIASIVYQDPALVAVHGKEMLP